MNDSPSEGSDPIVVSCPTCQEKYSVSASRIPPQGGRLTCRICGGRVLLPPGRRAMPGAPVVAKAPGSAAQAVTATPKPRTGTAVECPHCGKSFSLASGAADAATKDSASDPASPGTSTPRPDSAPITSGSRGRQKTILVAEDTEFFLELVTETLGSQYRMLRARTKAEALGLLGREAIDLVILDITLETPEDGLEVLAGAAPRGVPCLIFTARNEADLWGEGWVRLQKQGASDLLLKGMNVEEQLLSKVAALLGMN